MEHAPPSNTSVRNVRAVAQIEIDKLNARSRVERVVDRVAIAAASISWLALHVAVISAWVLWNIQVVPYARAFDPSPFGLLALCISIESLVLMVLFLIRQNGMMRVADRRAHLDLQLNMLTEQESTATLRMVRQLCIHHGLEVEQHRHAQELQQPTDIDRISNVLDCHLPD